MWCPRFVKAAAKEGAARSKSRTSDMTGTQPFCQNRVNLGRKHMSSKFQSRYWQIQSLRQAC
jgi:hypothetical protein